MVWRATRSALTVAAGLLALIVITAGTVAASGHVAMVNGVPGKTMEVCVNGHEIKAGLKYGQTVVRNLSNGSKHLRLRVNSPGRCQGSPMGRKAFEVVGGTDVTIVVTRFNPAKVMLFDNSAIPTVEFASQVIVRHAADIGPAGFKHSDPEAGIPWVPTADVAWQKGESGYGPRLAGELMTWWAHQPPKQRAIAGPFQLIVAEDKRHELILVGTSLGNVKFARFTTSQD